MIERLTDEQKSEYIGILNYVRYKYPNADKNLLDKLKKPFIVVKKPINYTQFFSN